MTKKETNKIEKLIIKLDIRLNTLETLLSEQQLQMKHEIWSEYVRISNYKKDLRKLITK